MQSILLRWASAHKIPSRIISKFKPFGHKHTHRSHATDPLVVCVRHFITPLKKKTLVNRPGILEESGPVRLTWPAETADVLTWRVSWVVQGHVTIFYCFSTATLLDSADASSNPNSFPFWSYLFSCLVFTSVDGVHDTLGYTKYIWHRIASWDQILNIQWWKMWAPRPMKGISYVTSTRHQPRKPCTSEDVSLISWSRQSEPCIPL